ncbi:helix-turn-helix domain-containing protein [Actinocatenispora sera]|uniref:TetR family transcriptional regulator n=1 Tax=Actinocatenispora sera TaxID=390989 RepID=A0A810LCR9_9ACTN|nr:TetR/AcrR family transcriptional regulator [Actinocatenispora sera]BCJ32021.1 TetR family transcriptional regulator [Actinocatenispora sera]
MTADRPRRADAARNRIRVLEAAETVFTERGIEEPVEKVAQAAGVGVGTVYRHYPTKRHLVEAIVARRMRRVVDEARILAAQGDPRTGLFDVMNRVMAEAIVKMHLGVTIDKTGSAAAGAEPMAEIAGDLTAALATLLARAQQADAVRHDLGPTDILQTLYGLSAAAEHYRWNAAERSHAIAIAVDGLRPR